MIYYTINELRKKIEVFEMSEQTLERELASMPSNSDETYIKSGALATVKTQREIAEKRLREYAVAG